MGDLRNTPAQLSATVMASRIRANRIAMCVAEQPAGPIVPPVIYRNSSFGGFPVAPLAIPALNPGDVAATYAFGD